MAKLLTLQRRMKSIRSIRQMTKAMELVAASKLRRVQERALQSRIYAQNARSVAQQLAAIAEAHPLCVSRPVTRRTLIILTSDRGLAGAYHTNIFRTVVHLLQQSSELPTEVIVVGQKGAQFISKLTHDVSLTAVFTKWPTPPVLLTHIRPLAKMVMDSFRAGATDEVVMVYTEFISLAVQRVVAQTLLPIQFASSSQDAHNAVLFEPSPQAVLDYMVPHLVELQLAQASLEAVASEQAMRMRAMKNASDNAEDLTNDLSLLYNSARQSAITQELAEITVGAEAMSQQS